LRLFWHPTAYPFFSAYFSLSLDSLFPSFLTQYSAFYSLSGVSALPAVPGVPDLPAVPVCLICLLYWCA
jgi:hypothetical protein